MATTISSPPLVSIIILNWNGAGLTEDCLASIRKLQYPNYEVIVVDNGSTDDSLERLRRIAGIQLIVNDKNLGYAAGNNVGFRVARGKYIAALNNDVVVEKNWLTHAVKCLEDDSRTGIVASRQMSYDNRKVIDALYSYVDHYLLPRSFGDGDEFRDGDPFHASAGIVLAANGAAAVYRRDLLLELGGFDERFFAYHEESDFCFRAFYRGWKCVYCPDAVVYHRKSSSFRDKAGTFRFLHERNRIWFIFKHYPIVTVVLNLGWLFLMEARLLRVVIFKERKLREYLRARIAGFAGMFRFWKDRRENVRLYLLNQRPFNALRANKKLPIT